MEKEFKPWFTEEPEGKEFKPLFGVKQKEEFSPYIEGDINSLVLVLEENDEGVFVAQDLIDLKKDLFDNCREKDEVLDVVFSYLTENIDDPEGFLKENSVLEQEII